MHRLSAILLLVTTFCSGAMLERLETITVVSAFDELIFNNESNNSIGSPYQSGGFTFSSSGIFVYRRNHASRPGSGAIYPTNSALITITRTGGGAFNFYSGHFAERSAFSAKMIGIGGTRNGGSTVLGALLIGARNSFSPKPSVS